MSSNSVSILDYGMGNTLSVARAFEQCGASVTLVSSAPEIIKASRIIIPGVGAFPKAMENLTRLGLLDSIANWLDLERPLLGICLGMQLMFDSGAEFSQTKGLGVISGEVALLPRIQSQAHGLKLPNVGWMKVTYLDSEYIPYSDPKDDDSEDSYYFVHSYYASPKDSNAVKGLAKYGDFDFTAIAAKDNRVGVQFHPEKSGERGLSFLRKFLTK
jgi:glutamine amidotransferase